MSIENISDVVVGTKLRVIEGGLHGIPEGTIVIVAEVDPEGLYDEYWRCEPAPNRGGWVKPYHVELV